MDCIGGQDESDCAGRFECDTLSGTKVSIDYLYVCDYNINCDNGEDEMDCQDGRFYCENKDPLFVASSKLFNGRGDCSDWSDECPTDMTNEDTFSSRYHLIANPILRVFVWIMGVLAVGGNLIVIVGEVLECKDMKKRGFASLRANHIFVLNLAVADLLMGVYLIILGGVGVVYQGRYCIDKYTWLTSALCSNIGVLVVVSSETSVVTMVILTSFRVYATYNPFSSQLNPRSWLVTLLIALSWMFALAIATIPFAPNLHHFFIEKAWIKGNPFFKSEMVGLTPAKIFVRRLLSFDSHFGNFTLSLLNQAAESRSWIDLLKVMESDPEGSHYLDIVGYFGYYSDNSVCIPKLYVKHSDAAWGFSLAISIFNFFSFIYVLVAYFAIYLKSSKSLLLHSKGKQQSMISKKNAAMQRKIIRLIITDFCCWVPISIMAFLSIGGYDIPSVVYSVSAIILLPINSALNPLLYSNFVDKVIDRMKKKPERQVSQSSENLQSTRV
ncbi:G-protein coupled receptor GRL101-like [Ciona intestinalis]